MRDLISGYRRILVTVGCQIDVELSLSHDLRMADALIAATAGYLDRTLCPANDRHYRDIPEIKLEIFRP